MRFLVEPRLEELFRQVLNLGSSSDVAVLSQADVPEWDSETHDSLVRAIEDEFGVEVDPADAAELTSFDSIARFLEGNGA